MKMIFNSFLLAVYFNIFFFPTFRLDKDNSCKYNYMYIFVAGSSENYLGDSCIVFENFMASIGDLMVAN
jgi:hypothetical protein